MHNRNRPTWTWCWLSHVCSLTFWGTKQFMILYHRQITVLLGINCWAYISFAGHGGIRHFDSSRLKKRTDNHSGYGSMLPVLANQNDAIQSEHGHLLSVFPSVTQRLPPMIIWCSRMTRQYLLYLREEEGRNWNLANCFFPPQNEKGGKPNTTEGSTTDQSTFFFATYPVALSLFCIHQSIGFVVEILLHRTFASKSSSLPIIIIIFY